MTAKRTNQETGPTESEDSVTPDESAVTEGTKPEPEEPAGTDEAAGADETAEVGEPPEPIVPEPVRPEPFVPGGDAPETEAPETEAPESDAPDSGETAAESAEPTGTAESAAADEGVAETPATEAAPTEAKVAKEPPSEADIAVTGLATMGRNLARNLARHGHVVAVHNRTKTRTDALVTEFGDEGAFMPCETLADVVAVLKKPRTVIIMVKAGASTDAVVDELADLLEPGDIIVDGGNAHYLDTRRRETAMQAKNIHFVGTGISGGEEGALNGPSIMPGGSAEAYQTVGPMLESIAAKVDDIPCCVHVGPDGAGHFVKMVHNGIEYADMQLISEAYDLMRALLGRSPSQLGEVFETWNAGDLQSYLIEITAKVLQTRDPRTGNWFVDVVRDEAEQKGTGRWTVQAALDLGTPVSGIAEAVFARALSGHVDQREAARPILTGPEGEAIPAIPDPDLFIDDVRQALYASKVVAYAQGFDMLAAGSQAYGWDLKLGDLATIWRGGCIIRARFLDRIREAYAGGDELPSLLVAPYFAQAVTEAQAAWRRVVTAAAAAGVPAPGFASALAYYDGLRRERSPAALVQGLRDLFGAHTYRRVDTPGVFHLDWAQEDPAGRVEYEMP